mmetsp:Transcript_100145/g.283548  ORF Transcript_100145/g.283548 Transcript_100145/m.283548 type:complete len:251 (+) Transcript_100145:507-1259(+)
MVSRSRSRGTPCLSKSPTTFSAVTNSVRTMSATPGHPGQPPWGVSPGCESRRMPSQPQNSRRTALFSMPGLRAPNSTKKGGRPPARAGPAASRNPTRSNRARRMPSWPHCAQIRSSWSCPRSRSQGSLGRAGRRSNGTHQASLSRLLGHVQTLCSPQAAKVRCWRGGRCGHGTASRRTASKQRRADREAQVRSVSMHASSLSISQSGHCVVIRSKNGDQFALVDAQTVTASCAELIIAYTRLCGSFADPW